MTRVGPLVCTLLTAALLVGCGGDETQPTATTSSSTASESAGTSPSPSDGASASASESPSESPSSSVTPAVGKREGLSLFSLVLPEGWTSQGGVGSGIIASARFASPEGLTTVDLTQIGGPATDFEESAELLLSNRKGAERVPDRTVGGQQVFGFEYANDTGRYYVYGRPIGNVVASVTFLFAPPIVTGEPEDLDAQRALVESLLATVQWQG